MLQHDQKEPLMLQSDEGEVQRMPHEWPEDNSQGM